VSFPRKLRPMKRSAILCLLALGGCAPGQQELANPVGNFYYGAISHDPFWLLSIGDRSIMLTLGPDGGRADGGLVSHSFPRSMPVIKGETRLWESSSGTQVITIETRPGPCRTGDREYADSVRVSLSGRQMQGCGGRELRGSASQTWR
jgi:uncharacterized membrane protein